MNNFKYPEELKAEYIERLLIKTYHNRACIGYVDVSRLTLAKTLKIMAAIKGHGPELDYNDDFNYPEGGV